MYFSGAIGSTLLYASVICLSIHIFIFTAIKKLRKPPAQNLLALTCALCPGQLLLVLALSNNTSHSICIASATFLHYFFLVAAFWMNVLHFDLCRVCFKRCFLNKVWKLFSLTSKRFYFLELWMLKFNACKLLGPMFQLVSAMHFWFPLASIFDRVLHRFAVQNVW